MKSVSRTSRALIAFSDARHPVKGSGIRTVPRRLLSIDPGLSGTGVVYWHVGVPKRAGVIHPRRYESVNDELAERALSIADQVLDFPYKWEQLVVVIEFPEYQEGLKGRTARSKGDLDKLSFLVGVIVGQFPRGTRIALPHVRDWKGQLPKDVVQRRMLKHYGKWHIDRLGVKSHAWDALGIGHWALQQEWS